MKNDRIAAIRKEYTSRALERSDLADDPLQQFDRWLQEAVAAEVPEPTAMTLATVDAAGQPSARIVLLKGVQEGGFTFYTNYQSRKGRELLNHPKAALVFFWPELERQVRVNGSVSEVPAEESDAYFASRPRGSRIGAWTSPQSEMIADRSVLEQRAQEITAKYEGRPVPRPPHWGGFRLLPHSLEFWQGRPSRLHDRFLFSRHLAVWNIKRLAP
ncbi:MAG: pyridoxamine 5'-phosphate oxidase [Catalinimonas sp.]